MTPILQNLELEDPFTGGETADRKEFLRVRGKLQENAFVHEVLALSWVPQEQRWLYAVRTVFATWPKFVIGWVDAGSMEAEILFRCQMEGAARECFNEQNIGDHQ